MIIHPAPAGVSETNREQDEVLDKMTTQHIRVAVVGNVDAGKSTLIGCLFANLLDNGRGDARARVTKHRHELISGRTSAIGTHLIGFDENGETIVSTSESEKVMKATRLVTLMDMAGHEKYLKTTVAGISRGVADYALVLVNANQPPTHMTEHHLRLCVAMRIPIIVVMTKADRSTKDVFRSTKQEVQAMLRKNDVALKPYSVSSEKDIDTVKGKVAKGLLTPVISVSCVTGEGLDTLKTLLRQLPPRRRLAEKQRKKDFEYLAEEIFQVPGVGTVVSGLVTRGEWKKGEPLHIGPLKDGSILQVTPKSVHVAQTNVDLVYAGHSVCFALPKISKDKRKLFTKGMVALKNPFVPTRKVMAEIYLLKGKNFTMAEGQFQATLNILHNKLAAKVVAMKDENGVPIPVTRNNAEDMWVTITFRLSHASAYLRPGMKVIMRDGHVLGYGGVVSVGE